MIFISHSSKDAELVKALNAFLVGLEIKQTDIFCSSIEGQGVKNGERINDTIQRNIKNSNIIVYLITQNFLKSPYCASELGAGWILTSSKDIFIFKSEDVSIDELKGFINGEYKFSSFDSNGLSALYDAISEKYKVVTKYSIVNNAINNFLETAKVATSILVENRDKDAEQIQKEKIQRLQQQYYDLAPGAKRILADIYFSYEGIRYYSMSNGIVGSLNEKLFIHRTTTISTGFQQFAYELQPWAKSFISNNPKIQKELKSLFNDERAPIHHEPGAIDW